MIDPQAYHIQPDSFGHRTRVSNASSYNEVCVLCGATDAGPDLDSPCPNPLETKMTETPTDPRVTLRNCLEVDLKTFESSRDELAAHIKLKEIELQSFVDVIETTQRTIASLTTQIDNARELSLAESSNATL